MKQISILGCGWLGLPLAVNLIERGFTIKGSTTSSDKVRVLENYNIKTYLISLTEADIKGKVDEFLKDSEILIINIPPKLRGSNKENFVKKIENIIPFLEKSNIQNVLFVSSTSVYGDSNQTITESTFPNPETESGNQLLEAEFLIMNNKYFNSTILRFGGLIGEDRHPIKHLAGKKNIENPDAPINLIHLTDCIGIIQSIIEKDCWNEIFNAVTPYHPSRQEYYSKKATEFNLPLPEFDTYKPSNGKKIMSNKIIHELGYKFKITEI